MAKQSEISTDHKPKLKRKTYEKELQQLQAELCHLQEWVKHNGERMIIIFEGRDGAVAPLELAHLPYKQGHTFEYFVGVPGLNRIGLKKWRQTVLDVVALLQSALQAEDVVLGGGNAKLLTELPHEIRLCQDWQAAYVGGCRLWQPPARLSSGRAA